MSRVPFPGDGFKLVELTPDEIARFRAAHSRVFPEPVKLDLDAIDRVNKEMARREAAAIAAQKPMFNFDLDAAKRREEEEEARRREEAATIAAKDKYYAELLAIQRREELSKKWPGYAYLDRQGM